MSLKNKHIETKIEKKTKFNKNFKKNIEVKNSEKTNKSKKSKFGFYFKIVIFIFLAVFLYLAVASTSNSYKGSIFQRLDVLKQNKVPYLLVIRDDFSTVSDENKKLIENIIKKADDIVTVFDITYNPRDISKESKYFLDKFDIESLPVVILSDEKGDLINTYYIPFNEKQILESVEKARESSGD